jgi:hypothetical protein
MSVGSALVLAFLVLLGGSMMIAAIKTWRNPEITADRVPFARSLPFGPEGRAAAGRAMLAWAGSIMFVCTVGVLTILRGSNSVQSARARELQPYAFVAMGGIVVSLLFVVTIVCFNQPKFLVPPHRRSELGLASMRRTKWRAGRD